LTSVAHAGETSGTAPPADGVSAQPPPVDVHVIPRPQSLVMMPRCSVAAGALLLGLARAPLDAGGMELLRERWSALGVRRATHAVAVSVAAWHESVSADAGPSAPPREEGYALDVAARGVRIAGHDAEGQFDALATLAQLAVKSERRDVRVPCVHIVDAPALRWRMLSDDVSRGPLPTMRYFEERIRTIASFKFNGYSPYMEHVFVDPKHPLPAPLDGIAPQQLHDLALYARRFHVTFVPEQQTFAHMHETLKWERYAALAETPHGYLLSPANPAGQAYVRDVIADELEAVPHPAFFHIGSDEPADLGLGRSKALVAAQGEGAVYARHVIDTADFVIAHGGGRPLVWDDALARHPELFGLLPKQLVFVNWHYGNDPTYRPYIDRIVRGGFEQLVAPGALNWNEIYPDLESALTNIDRFVTEGKAAHVLGLFQTVWHDDGETLFEATWYPVIYAGASAWEAGPVDQGRYSRDFPAAFFGTDDPQYAADLAALGRCNTLLHGNPRDNGDYLFWADPLAPDLANVPALMDLPALRLAAEGAIAHLRLAPPPPLHANAAAVMFLAARRYDALGREYQIPQEARAYYDEAVHNAATHKGSVYRGLYLARYLFWEQRDTMLALEPLMRAAWEYEDRPSHEQSVLERYRIAADRAIGRADRLGDVTFGDYAQKKRLPSFDAALGIAAQP
ncbi:MAG: beta-N-acetylhexosaminidase, partial [Candidatus Eremiobacteraeota bacterium]|nr:beta-N-acetylhexosaminidase [Candidatus Eremiobacteraeota bacterium]